MKNCFVLLLFSFIAFHFSFSQSDTISWQDSSRVKIPDDTSSFYVIELKDGTVLKGKIAEHKDNEIVFLDNNLGKTTIKTRKIFFIEKLSSDAYFIFYMKDGSFLHGRIRRYTKDEIHIETKNIGTKIIPLVRVKEMRQIEEKDIHFRGRYWYPNMNASRYLFGPSAIPLGQGEGYFQNADLLVNCVNYGITNHFSVQTGGIVPFAFFIMPKYGTKLRDNLYVGGGAAYAVTLLKFRKTNYKYGAAYALATFGNKNTNLTFGTGYGFSNINDETIIPPKPLFIASGTARISRRFALVTENVIVPVQHCYYVAAGKVCEYNYKTSGSFGLRFMKQKTTIDLAFLRFPQEIIGAFVWADIVFRF